MSGMLMDERFVAVFPSLVRLLGSIEAAVILQHLHWCADENGDIRISQQQISDETGIALRTVERKVRWLRDEGWVSAHADDSYDRTLTYRIEHSKLAGEKRGMHTANVAGWGGQNGGIHTAKVAGSSIQKKEEPTQVGLEPSPEPHNRAVTDGEHPDGHAYRRTFVARPEPTRHPSRPIDSWTPSGTWLDYLALTYPHVDVNAAYTRFRNFHYAKQDTSKSWDALFENWVANDEDRIIAATLGGTDELGVPRTQRGTSIVGPPLQPGDEGYFDPAAD